MSVIIYNKRTGKYLRRHSGSYNRFVRFLMFNKEIQNEVEKLFGECPNWTADDPEPHYEWRSKAYMFRVDRACDAEPEEARVYHSKGSALNSVGELNPRLRGRHTPDKRLNIPVYVLPDYFEIHEIKQVAVCVMRPDGTSNCDDDT